MARAGTALALTLAACTFNPSVDDTSLVDCLLDSDCPRGASCVAQVCVPAPLAIVSMTATPEVVEAGESCSFAATATHSLRAGRLHYRWHQILGPAVALTGGGEQVELTTAPDYVGSYAVEVIVENGRDPPVRGRVHCTALVSSEAEWVVPGQTGDCSRERPCGAISDTSARRVYVGIEESLADRPWVISSSGNFDDRELHAGFLFPSWQRDMDRARVSLGADGWSVACDSCVLSGFTQDRSFPATTSWRWAIHVTSNDVTLRELRVILRGGADTAVISGIATSAPALGPLTLEGVEVLAAGVEAREIWGLDFTVGTTHISDTLVDLRDAVARDKLGAIITQNTEPPVLRRLRVHLGAAEYARGLVATCAAPRIENCIIDVRGGGSSDISEALHIDSPAGCPTGGVAHSSLFAAGGGSTSHGVRLLDAEPSLDMRNCIIDGGHGFARVGLDVEGVDGAVDLSGTVIVLDGGAQSRDHFVRSSGSGIPVSAFESAISCPGCLSTSGGAAYANADSGDFHLTASSTCCIDTGTPLGPGDPPVDYDGVARDAQSPAAGPYELVVY